MQSFDRIGAELDNSAEQLRNPDSRASKNQCSFKVTDNDISDQIVENIGTALIDAASIQKILEDYKSPLDVSMQKTESQHRLGTFLSSTESAVRAELLATSTFNKNSALLRAAERTDSLMHSGEKTSKDEAPSNTHKLSYKRAFGSPTFDKENTGGMQVPSSSKSPRSALKSETNKAAFT